jgi:hypothetical protein
MSKAVPSEYVRLIVEERITIHGDSRILLEDAPAEGLPFFRWITAQPVNGYKANPEESVVRIR